MKSKRFNKLALALALVSGSLALPAAQASILELADATGNTNISVTAGSAFSLYVKADVGTAQIVQGSVDVSWGSGLNFTGYSWQSGLSFSFSTPTVTANGVSGLTAGNVGFVGPTPVFNPAESAQFDFMKLDFTADPAAAGTTVNVNLVANSGNYLGWASEQFDPVANQFQVYDYNFTNVYGANVSIVAGGSTAVPVPPALWLFGTGLLGLVGIGRRRQN